MPTPDDHVECYDCGATFPKQAAFRNHQGCPECPDEDIWQLFEQRSDERPADPDNVEITTNFDGTVEVKEA